MAEATNDAVLDGQEDLFAGLGTWDGLVRWADALVALQEERGGQGGCPIANLLGQVGERDDDIRAVLASGFDRWEADIRAGLAAMVASGELRAGTDLDWLAASTLASVQGGLVLSQARRDPRPLRAPSTAHSPSSRPTARGLSKASARKHGATRPRDDAHPGAAHACCRQRCGTQAPPLDRQ